jgi:hypothetical protein
MKRLLFATVVGLFALVVASAASAGSVTTFGTLAGATFGGSGIPNDNVAITTITVGSDVLTLGLTATGRYDNPQLGDNNAGTFYAKPGVVGGLATWNFDFYADIKGAGSYTFKLLYDFDPAAGTLEASLGVITFPGTGSTFVAQDSWNLAMPFLGHTVSGLTAPLGSFNPNANGEYTFLLQAYDSTGTTLLGQSAILVNVPDGGATLTLLGCALVGLGALRRKFRG